MTDAPKRKSPSEALKGNTNGTKLKDSDVRQEAFRQYCAHLASGYPREAFFFDHPTHSVSWETMERYIEENPSEFPPILIKKAMAIRYKHWLDKGNALMEGQFKGSPTIWTVCMRNLFRDVSWDKEQIAENNRGYVRNIAASLREEDSPESEAETSDSKLDS